MVTTIEQHLAWCQRRELRPGYIAEIGRTLLRVQELIGPLEDATEEAIEAWWVELANPDRDPPCGAGARNAYVAHLASFYGWLKYERLRVDDPTDRLIRPRTRRGIPRPIGDADLKRAIGAAGQPIRSWLLLAALEGFRACEVAALCREDIRDDLGVIIVRGGKGGHQRSLALHPLVASALEYGPASGHLYLGRSGKRPLTGNAVSQRANRYLHELGIVETFHQLRHHFGSSVYRTSHDLRLTQELMGHASPTTTAGYAAWDPGKAAAVISALGIPA